MPRISEALTVPIRIELARRRISSQNVSDVAWGMIEPKGRLSFI